MDDIRLKTAPFEWRGEKIKLCCNMNVLADVQEAYGGDISRAFKGSTIRATLTFLTAMINDATDGDLTVREVGREIPISQLGCISGVVLPLVTDALKGEDTEKKRRQRRTAKFCMVSCCVGDGATATRA
jgi:hypothetical protein